MSDSTNRYNKVLFMVLVRGGGSKSVGEHTFDSVRENDPRSYSGCSDGVNLARGTNLETLWGLGVTVKARDVACVVTVAECIKQALPVLQNGPMVRVFIIVPKLVHLAVENQCGQGVKRWRVLIHVNADFTVLTVKTTLMTALYVKEM
jgi:hypothetical protein